jgi:hypothetical protein
MDNLSYLPNHTILEKNKGILFGVKFSPLFIGVELSFP